MGRLKNKSMASEAGAGRPATLGDIASRGLDIFCWCNRCSHNGVLAADLLIARMGPAVAVPEIGARLRCGSCGSKDIATRPAWPGLGQVARHT
jgi:hypothetical protein